MGVEDTFLALPWRGFFPSFMSTDDYIVIPMLKVLAINLPCHEKNVFVIYDQVRLELSRTATKAVHVNKG